MKKSIMVAVVVFLLTIPAVYAQQVLDGPPQFQFPNAKWGGVMVQLIPNGNTLRFRLFFGDNLLSMDVNFEGKLNGKSIEFKRRGVEEVRMNDGKLSIESGFNRIKSGLGAR